MCPVRPVTYVSGRSLHNVLTRMQDPTDQKKAPAGTGAVYHPRTERGGVR